MKIANFVLSWVITVIVGSVICGLFTGKPAIALVFAVLSGLFSLPYLVLIIVLNLKKRHFIVIQLIHFLLAATTGFVIVLFENSAFRHWYVLFVYFFIGVGTQAIFYYRKPLEQKKEDEELLDS
ncbi:MAG: hypothetical protein K9G40_12270 [Crocinitomicaceae bacterium]|jgi:hypothetical protein|nr:hypothetical protein [Crocinitomicaceae bacterium]